MIDLRHPLAVLATRMPWSTIEATLVPLFERRTREGQSSTVPDGQITIGAQLRDFLLVM
jgi:IS5 family transposase